jgi:hypothetical protein
MRVCACDARYDEITNMLLSNRADPNAVRNDGVTPLYVAYIVHTVPLSPLFTAHTDMVASLRTCTTKPRVCGLVVSLWDTCLH